ncbi:hypothetical protein MTsPCn5_18990 [Croceitalea sp. MTPC5]|uniref:DUF2141 domain-containing protein n=1 Tax=Croceitalea sp. MTPC5 TaxID=3056565 RepID=UPI002B39597C|nr:hypothetical protein MTsPCn5_18990 [Croceitalea sp. MTPC5]
MKKFLLVLMLIPVLGLAQHQINVNVEKVPSSSGKISIALYNSQDAFLKFDKVYSFVSAEANTGTTSLLLDDIPTGEYAIAIFYDENANDELDTNWLGIPKEKVAFSNAKMKTFGPPKFKECAFEVKADKTVTISL